MREQYYTTHEVSKFCNVYPSTVINWIEEGLLSAFTTPGGHRRISKEGLIKLMQNNNMPIPARLMENRKNRVLVLDDDPKIAKMIKTILEAEEDFEITSSESGFGAGLVVAQWEPDVILLDFLMPEVDGFEVTRQLRKDNKTKEIPIIAITVLRDKKKVQKMYEAGVTDYLAKPFKSTELVDKVRKCIKV